MIIIGLQNYSSLIWFVEKSSTFSLNHGLRKTNQERVCEKKKLPLIMAGFKQNYYPLESYDKLEKPYK